MVKVDDSKLVLIGNVLNDPNRPLKERFRALFTLKNIGGQQSIKSIAECFRDESALLKHELAYCLGQMQDVAAIPYLISVLEDVNQEPMVRHEAGMYLLPTFSEVRLTSYYHPQHLLPFVTYAKIENFFSS